MKAGAWLQSCVPPARASSASTWCVTLVNTTPFCAASVKRTTNWSSPWMTICSIHRRKRLSSLQNSQKGMTLFTALPLPKNMAFGGIYPPVWLSACCTSSWASTAPRRYLRSGFFAPSWQKLFPIIKALLFPLTCCSAGGQRVLLPWPWTIRNENSENPITAFGSWWITPWRL